MHNFKNVLQKRMIKNKVSGSFPSEADNNYEKVMVLVLQIRLK